MNKKHYQNIYHANVNVNLIVENVIQIKSEITKMKKTCPEIIKVTKIVPIKTAPTKSASTNFYILLTFFINYQKSIDDC